MGGGAQVLAPSGLHGLRCCDLWHSLAFVARALLDATMPTSLQSACGVEGGYVAFEACVFSPRF